MKQPHLLCDEKDIAPYVLLPGDPARVLRAASQLDEWREVAFNREFRTVTGTYKGIPVSIVSTGIGGASAAIAVEELVACGAQVLIRIGSAGAVQKEVQLGDLIIAQGAVREDGASAMYVGKGYPAVADPELAMLLTSICRGLEYACHTGIVRSHDSFYIDEEAEIMARWNKKGILGSDMETAALFTVAKLRGARAASILNNVVLYQADVKEGISDYVDEDVVVAEGERRQIFAALEVVKRLADQENVNGVQ